MSFSRRHVLQGLGASLLLPRLGFATEAPDLSAALAALEATSGGRLGVQLLDATGEVVMAHRATERFAMCSTVKALLLAGFAFDTMKVAPGDSGTRVLEVATAVRQWATASASTIKQQQALVLRSTREGTSPFELYFASREAAAALRPRLRVSYALRSSFGIP